MTQTSHSNWIDSFLGCLRSCFGFYKSVLSPVIEDEEHYNSAKIEDQAAQKPLLYDSFLSSSTYDLEHNYFHINNSSVQSLEKSIASVNQQAEGSSADSHEFRNHGLLHWNETRQQWLGCRRQRRKSQEIGNPRIRRGMDTVVSAAEIIENQKRFKQTIALEFWNATYENLLGTNRRFNQPIPLSEMVDFLVDVWEQEGLYENTTFGII